MKTASLPCSQKDCETCAIRSATSRDNLDLRGAKAISAPEVCEASPDRQAIRVFAVFVGTLVLLGSLAHAVFAESPAKTGNPDRWALCPNTSGVGLSFGSSRPPTAGESGLTCRANPAAQEAQAVVCQWSGARPGTLMHCPWPETARPKSSS